MERRIVFNKAWDKRDSDPSKNYGVHGVEIAFYLIGDDGAVQFVIYTNWHIPSVQQEFDNKPPRSEFPYLSHKPLPADLGYHSYKPTYEGQEALTDNCHLLGGPCYYDGSTLNAERIFKILTVGGSEAVWTELENYYKEVFNNG